MLYICPTPLGNLEDITLRVLRVLKEVDLIAAEETDYTKKLLSHFSISTPMMCYYDSGNSEIKEEKLLQLLGEGKSIALVSSAGTPLISDPGYKLVKKCIEQEIEVISLPGPSAAVAALVTSGLPPHNFFFGGFPPSKSSARKIMLKKIALYPCTIVLYEAPHRIKQTLEECLEIFGDRPIALVRELTKMHEEIIRGSFKEVINKMTSSHVKGEFTVIIGGNQEGSEVNWEKVKDEINNMKKMGIPPSQISKELAEKYEISKNKIYDLAHPHSP